MQEGEFLQAREDLAELEDDYKEAGLETNYIEKDHYYRSYQYWGIRSILTNKIIK